MNNAFITKIYLGSSDRENDGHSENTLCPVRNAIALWLTRLFGGCTIEWDNEGYYRDKGELIHHENCYIFNVIHPNPLPGDFDTVLIDFIRPLNQESILVVTQECEATLIMTGKDADNARAQRRLFN